jgi:peroxiredoxin Q/BCP
VWVAAPEDLAAAAWSSRGLDQPAATRREKAQMALTEGRKAPAFTLSDAQGNRVRLADFSGQDVILYFYPRDDTPGCTKEACGFRSLHRRFQKAGVAVLGISPDSPESHQRFARKYRLPFPLLCDPDRKMMTRYGAYGEKVMYGRKTMGVIRSTVWIGPNGRVKKHWPRVAKAADHPQQVLDTVEAGA